MTTDPTPAPPGNDDPFWVLESKNAEAVMESKPLLVGELNPYGGNPAHALYPAPDGCSGHRLCCTILGMRRTAYLDAFERKNLCVGRWSARDAKAAAREIRRVMSYRAVILLGAKVAAAFRLPFAPFTSYLGWHPGLSVLVLPHPSGLCRLWNEPGAVDKARAAVRALVPEIAELIGVCDE